jgi:hypothetical protein
VNTTTKAAGRHDTLLEWASELAEGSWAQWRAACAELDVEPTLAMQDLAALGHVEMDWSADRFACPPPTAAFLHRSSGCVLLTGARPRGLLNRLAGLEAHLDLDFVVHEPCPQHRGPKTVLIEVELDDAEQLCEAAELTWVFDPADRIASALPVSTLAALASREDWPPRDDVPRQHFDPATMEYRIEPACDSERGLWRYDGYRRAEAWFFDEKHWWHLPTREYAPYLAHPDVTFIRFRQAARQLLVPCRVPLPPLQARAATLASGRLPRRTSASGPESSNWSITSDGGMPPRPSPPSWTYENISEALARRIAGSLATTLGRLP